LKQKLRDLNNERLKAKAEGSSRLAYAEGRTDDDFISVE